MTGSENTLTVNGKPYPYSKGLTVASLIAAVYAGSGAVVAEVNAGIVPRERHGETPLHPGDVVELVHFVGGG